MADSAILWKTKLQKTETFYVRLNVSYKGLDENGASWKILEFYLTLKNDFERANTYEFMRYFEAIFGLLSSFFYHEGLITTSH